MTTVAIATSSIGDVRAGVPFHTRLYVWSVILEPLFFFVIFDESVLGITGNLSRLLQMATLVLLVIRLALFAMSEDGYVTLPNVWRPLYRNYALMMGLAALAGLIGYARGAYDIPTEYSLAVGRSALSSALNSTTVRPILEYMAALYYFVYFVVIAHYLLVTRADVDYALSRMRRMFLVTFVIGAVDVALALAGFNLGRSLLPRHLGDSGIVEARFHGLAGEPRQAFVYIVLFLAIVHLMAFRAGRPIRRSWVLALVAAGLLTQSMTGVLGVAMFLGLYALYALSGLSPRQIIRWSAVAGIVGVVGYLAIVQSPRLTAYAREASNLWTILETSQELPYLMSKSNSDIYPMYDLTVKARAGDWLPVVIGSGMGAASATTNRYYRDWAELNNPHSQLARSLYETGLVGTLLYVMAFVRPVREYTRGTSPKQQRGFMVILLLLIGCAFADRSSAPFIYLGLLAAVFETARREARRQGSQDVGAWRGSPA